MKGYSTKQITDPWFKMPDDHKELVKVYRTLAKSADQRLVRLESYQYDESFATSTKWAYARAMRDIKSWSGEEAKRFNTAPPESKTDLLAKIQDIKHFLESPTSTKQGIINVYKKRADTINARHKKDKDWTKLTWKDLAQYWDSAMYEKMESKVGSDVLLKIFASVKKHKSEIEQNIKEKKDIHIKLQDEVTEVKVNEFISKYPDDVQQLLK